MIDKKNEKIEEMKIEINDKDTELESLKSKMNKLEQDLVNQTKQSKMPILDSPNIDTNLIGQNVIFRWRYNQDIDIRNPKIELIKLPNNINILEHHVLNPEQYIAYLDINDPGTYLWRLKEDKSNNKNKFISKYSKFHLYESVIDRIKKTKKIIVGTSPTYTGHFTIVDDKGNLSGYDIDLMNWLSDKIASKLSIEKLEVIFVDTNWDNLLPDLSNHKFDILISAMTSTKTREDNNKGIEFSKGYFQSHQIFIHYKKDIENDFPYKLKDKKVGVTKNTTNERAARYLLNNTLKDYKFKIDDNYKNYAEIYDALSKRQIEFALVDDILVANDINSKYFAYGPENVIHLDDYLLDFYKNKLGRDKEEYALAMYDEPKFNTDLKKIVDEIFNTQEWNEKKIELENKWKLTDKLDKLYADVE